VTGRIDYHAGGRPGRSRRARSGDHAAQVHDGELVNEAGARAGVEAAPGARSKHEAVRGHQIQLRLLPRQAQPPAGPIPH